MLCNSFLLVGGLKFLTLASLWKLGVRMMDVHIPECDFDANLELLQLYVDSLLFTDLEEDIDKHLKVFQGVSLHDDIIHAFGDPDVIPKDIFEFLRESAQKYHH